MLINCVAYQDGRKLGNIAATEIRSYVSRPDCFVWVAIKDPDDAELEAMQQEFDLHELDVEDARHGHQRPKIEEYGHSIFVVLHMLEIAGDDLRAGEMAIFVGSNYVLSVRRGVEKGFSDVRARCEREPELLRHGSAYVLYALMDAVVDRYFPVVESLETEIERIEEKIFSNQTTRANIEDLYGLKQRLMVLKHAAAPLLEATGKLYGGRVPQLCLSLQDYFRDVGDHLVRVNQSIEGLRDMVTTAISVNLALVSMQENENTKKLAAYAALVAVPTLIAGVYGMNFRSMPGLNSIFGLPVVLALMLALDVYLFTRFRKAKWL